MKKILFPLVLLICSIRLFSQDGGYDSFEHPMLKKLLGKAPAIIGFSEKEADKWISIAVLDSNTRTLYLFTQTGLLHSELDVPDSVTNKLQARELSPFEFYKSVIQTDLALFDFAITKLRFPAIEYSIPGVNDFDKEIRDIIKETGGKTKRDKLRVLLQKRKVTQYDLATIDLKLTGDVPTDSTFKDLLYRKNQILQNGYYISAGTVKKEFYALNSLSTLFKAVLHEERKCLVFYEKDDSPYDSMRLNAQQLQQISKNKINVFSLYQDYVMRQLERADSVVWGLYVAARRSGKNEPFSAMAAYQPGAGNKKARAYQQQQQLLTRLHLTASSSSYRIRQYISYLQNTALVYKVGKYDENSETLFIFTTTRVRRGRKQYELTDHRGNVMATISDKKVAVDTNGDGKVDHYAPDVVSATDYAPFGMALPGRNYSNEKYRYGFNGMQKENEIYGEGKAYDFGSRVYDSRLGRWFSTDPLQKKYPGWSPYNYAMNSPSKLRDGDGEDVIVTITENSITFSSTIYITGPGATEVAKNANTNFEEFSNTALKNRTYKDVNGKVYSVQIKMSFVSVNPDDPNEDPVKVDAYKSILSDKVGSSGNNILNLTDAKKNLYEGTRANAGHPAGENYLNTSENFTAGNGQIQRRAVRGVGNMAWLNQTKSAASNGVTAIHETFHNFGLGDRYIEKVMYKWESSVGTIKSGTAEMTVNAPGFSGDIMSIGKGALSSFSQVHIDNLAAKALELSKTKGNNFVMSQQVDNARSVDTENAPQEFTEGKTKYTKVPKTNK